jgi:hypothetical protein
MTVDHRTRVDRPRPPVDPATFFERELPAAFTTQAALIAPAATWLAPPPLSVEVDGTYYRLALERGHPDVQPGDRDGNARLRLTTEQLTDLVHDQVTPIAWFSSGTLALSGMRLERLLDWWLLVRGALDARAPYVPGAVDLTDEDGSPLDLHRSFRLGDPPDVLRRFLERAGYLRLDRVFSEAEMAAIAVDMDRAAPRYVPGDGRSWWATTEDGHDRLVRMQGFDAESPAVARLLDDERIRRIEALTGDGHRLAGQGEPNRIEALVKPLGVVRGLSDLPWHKDCAQGRHSYMCCSLTLGISVTGADATSGQLRVIAGSHRALMWPSFLRLGHGLPEVDLPTRTGDVTVHLSCTLHMAQRPVTRERRVLYAGLRLPPLVSADPEAEAAAVQRARAVREAAPVTVSQPAPARTTAPSGTGVSGPHRSRDRREEASCDEG